MNQDEEYKQQIQANDLGAAQSEFEIYKKWKDDRDTERPLENKSYSELEEENKSLRHILSTWRKTTAQEIIKGLEDKNCKLRLELHTLRFKEAQEQRFIWWIYNVYGRNVDDLIHAIMGATTYDTEGEAKDGKYGLPPRCFELIRRISEYSEHIYDGTYLDAVISTDANPRRSENKLDSISLEYAAMWIENSLVGEQSERVIEFGKNMAMSIRAAKQSNTEGYVTQNITEE